MATKKQPEKQPAKRTTKKAASKTTRKPRKPRAQAAPEPTIEVDDDAREPWHRQPWDTDDSFTAFQECWLTQNPPRKVSEAFRRWQELNGRTVRYNDRGQLVMNPHFFNWTLARNEKKERPPGSVFDGALTWQERSDAFDRDVYDRRLAAIRRERISLRDKEFAAGDTLLQRALNMIAAMPSPAQYTEADIVKLTETAFKLMRRALSMEDRTVAVRDWRTAFEEAGLDGEEIYNKTVERLVQQLESSATE